VREGERRGSRGRDPDWANAGWARFSGRPALRPVAWPAGGPAYVIQACRSPSLPLPGPQQAGDRQAGREQAGRAAGLANTGCATAALATVRLGEPRLRHRSLSQTLLPDHLSNLTSTIRPTV